MSQSKLDHLDTVESVQETNSVKKYESTPIYFTTKDSTEIFENQIAASVKPNKIESSMVELCQTLGKFDFSGILNKLLANRSPFLTNRAIWKIKLKR